MYNDWETSFVLGKGPKTLILMDGPVVIEWRGTFDNLKLGRYMKTIKRVDGGDRRVTHYQRQRNRRGEVNVYRYKKIEAKK